MENFPISPTGIESFSSIPNIPPEEQTLIKARPKDLPIHEKPAVDDYSGTPISDNVLLTVMMYLQHQNCSNPKTCSTCKLIKRQLERISEHNRQESLQKAIKSIQTHDTEGQKQLRRREKHPTPVPMHSKGVKFERQRSHSTSRLHDEELTFSDNDEITHRKKRQSQKYEADDEYSTTDDDIFPRLPLRAISKLVSLSEPDLTPTPDVSIPTEFSDQTTVHFAPFPNKFSIRSDDSGFRDDSKTSQKSPSSHYLDGSKQSTPSSINIMLPRKESSATLL